MPGEIQIAHGTTGRTLYAVVRSFTGTVWRTATSAFEAFTAANWSTYAVTLTEQGSSGYYVGDFPSAIAAGVYAVEVRDRAGGSPAVSDAPVGVGDLEWGGAAVVPLSSRLAPATAGRTLDVDAAGRVLLQPVTHTGATVPTVTTVSGSVGSVAGNVGGSVGSVAAGVNVTQIAGAGPVDGLLGMSVEYLSFGQVSANVQKWRGGTPNGLVTGRVDAIDANSADIKAKTDQLAFTGFGVRSDVVGTSAAGAETLRGWVLLGPRVVGEEEAGPAIDFATARPAARVTVSLGSLTAGTSTTVHLEESADQVDWTPHPLGPVATNIGTALTATVVARTATKRYWRVRVETFGPAPQLEIGVTAVSDPDVTASVAQVRAEAAAALAAVGVTSAVTGRIDAAVSSRLSAAGYTAPPTAATNADTLLGRSIAGGANGGRTVRDALRAARNRVAFDVPAAGQFTVFAEDDATPAWVGTYARGANTLGPLTAVDPA